ncbi:MAG: serine hydroxymethyltransferase [Chlamydiae bacterium CG10_big_fil_rev_8_21_14_0_10_35_9]|nr:MAG: serine hydroxymethyltransferase [Chlamydiae bacterium CG10_big_fil_rev_8_21_14_0_10_35_9]
MYLENYFDKVKKEKRTKKAIAYMAALDAVGEKSPEIPKEIIRELEDQRSHLKLIASENYSSLEVQLAMGNLFTDKYSEGYVGHRFYAGCEHVDAVEGRANELAKEIFEADHAYVQPHSGADANLVALWAILYQKVQTPEMEALSKKNLEELTKEEHEKIRQLLINQKVMGMSLNSGGHLTHGYRYNVTAKMMNSFPYEVDPNTALIDYAALQKQVKEVRPLILIAGYSAYSRLIDFAKMREIADSVGAVLLVDMAHFAGLVAGKVMTGVNNPIPYAHIVTSTTHKTLRGPRGGLVLCQKEFSETVDKGCPIVLGGPMPHVIAAKAVAFAEAKTDAFKTYASQIVKNAKALAKALIKENIPVITRGTDNHIVLVDVAKGFGLTGRQAELALREASLTCNRNSIPLDENGPWYTSGIRLGAPAVTTLGMKEDEMEVIAKTMVHLLKNTKPTTTKEGKLSKAKFEITPSALEKAKGQVKELLIEYPLYPELVLGNEAQNVLKKTEVASKL